MFNSEMMKSPDLLTHGHSLLYVVKDDIFQDNDKDNYTTALASLLHVAHPLHHDLQASAELP